MPSTILARQSGSSSSLLQKANTPSGRLSTGSPGALNAVAPRRTSSLKKVNSGKGRGKGRSSGSTLTFEEPESTVFIDREMLKNHHMDTAPSRRGPVRIDQDGPWSVSIAESPHDSRTVMEIVELDHKLRDSIVSTSKLPTLPLDPASIPAVPKRKSAFLNTLSRLASPTSAKSGTRRPVVNGNVSSTTPSGLPTPAASPSIEQNDPFVSFTASSALLNAALPTPSATSTALAAYFTTLSNLQPVRQARAWKRFVRVRTDDLESTRVERAIKRIRSDLAAHVGGTRDKTERGGKMNKLIESLTLDSKTAEKREELGHNEEEKALPAENHEVNAEEESDELNNEEGGGKELPDVPEAKPESGSGSSAEASNNQILTSPAPEDAEPTSPTTTTEPTSPTAATSTAVIDLSSTPRASEEEPRAPVTSAPTPEPPSTATSRVPRSQSADPDRRISRAYHSSVHEGNLSSSQTETGDESSSISTAARSMSKSARKKRKEINSSAAASLSGSQKELTKKKSQRKVVVDDFEMLRVLGKGCAGKVLLVRHKATADLYAMKAITKRHVLAHQELQHTLTEQAVLKRMAAVDGNGQPNPNGVVKDPFVVKLWWSFHDKENLFLVMDFHPGGDLATQLARWGRLGRDRARFYAAEIVEGVEGLHAAGVIYRDLKPENILIGADGHIVLTDFGLSKEFPRRRDAVTAPATPSGKDFVGAQPPWMKDTGSEIGNGVPVVDTTTTFCGTAEYLAPEVIQALPYSYEIDWWSFGTMLYEMLTGITPFWANNHSDMYVRVLQDELQFPDERSMDQDTKSLIRGVSSDNSQTSVANCL